MKKILPVALFAIVLTGCLTPEVTHISFKTFAPIPIEDVRLVATYRTNWVKVAELSVRAWGSDQAAADEAKKSLIKDAASLGANRLVVRRGNIYPNRAYWMNGWAFRE